jgi:hypothetical protein
MMKRAILALTKKSKMDREKLERKKNTNTKQEALDFNVTNCLLHNLAHDFHWHALTWSLGNEGDIKTNTTMGP